jgi:DNA adenine methylase
MLNKSSFSHPAKSSPVSLLRGGAFSAALQRSVAAIYRRHARSSHPARLCQSHYEELLRYMRFLVPSREWYLRLQNTTPESLTDIQRAARYFYLQKQSHHPSAGEQPALKVDDDHVRRLQQELAHSRWRNRQSTLIEANREISGCSRHEAEARQPFAEAH